MVDVLAKCTVPVLLPHISGCGVEWHFLLYMYFNFPVENKIKFERSQLHSFLKSNHKESAINSTL